MLGDSFTLGDFASLISGCTCIFSCGSLGRSSARFKVSAILRREFFVILLASKLGILSDGGEEKMVMMSSAAWRR